VDLDVLFVGTAGSVPTQRRGLAATLVRRGGERLLIDCGEGTQRQLVCSVGLQELDAVFITHFHADHVLGLPGMLKTFGLRGRERPLTVYGPRGLDRLFRDFQPLVGRTGFEVGIVELDPPDEVERDGYRIAAFEVDHGVRAVGYALLEDERPGRVDVDRARQLGVEEGPALGRLQRGEAVEGAAGEVRPEQVVGGPRRGRKLVVTGDTAPTDLVRAVAWRADLLVHEATFCAEDAARARETRHSTALDAGGIGADAEVKMLALTHLSSRYPAAEVRDEARAVHEATIVPRDFDSVEIPFPERGPPVHHRGHTGAERPAAEASSG